jgi:lipopolysaccharide export system permease protein
MYRLDQDSMDVLSFSSYRVSLDLNRLLNNVSVDRDEPRYMSWPELHQVMKHPEKWAEKGSEFYRTAQVERHKRLALPVACIVLGLVALPLGWILDELKRQYGAIVIVGVFLAYYAVFSLGISLGQLGLLPAAVGAWGPNALFLILSAVLFKYALYEGKALSKQRIVAVLQEKIRQ